MIAGTPGKWLVPLADLSLILFIVTGSSLAAILEGNREVAPAQGVASALYVDGPGAPPLLDMLAVHDPAEGEQLTIHAYYAPEEREAVHSRAETLAEQAIAAGLHPRVIVQPAEETLVIARFAHDADAGLARALQREGE
ncbi:hypothetical protein [Aurantiacibacter odishensis]|uniref:hypothetical protein n=1 Tax=Aurantiacibacter odishensis TaxID=1155476 RepID=UPI000E75C3B6|nr:hypothetical protein [Aurantiacibacter odishensis]